MPTQLVSSNPPTSLFQASLLCLDPPPPLPDAFCLRPPSCRSPCLTTFDSIYLLVLSCLTAFDFILHILYPPLPDGLSTPFSRSFLSDAFWIQPRSSHSSLPDDLQPHPLSSPSSPNLAVCLDFVGTSSKTFEPDIVAQICFFLLSAKEVRRTHESLFLALFCWRNSEKIETATLISQIAYNCEVYAQILRSWSHSMDSLDLPSLFTT